MAEFSKNSKTKLGVFQVEVNDIFSSAETYAKWSSRKSAFEQIDEFRREMVEKDSLSSHWSSLRYTTHSASLNCFIVIKSLKELMLVGFGWSSEKLTAQKETVVCYSATVEISQGSIPVRITRVGCVDVSL